MIFLLLLSINISKAQIKSYAKTSFGVSFILEAGKMNIYLLKDDIVEVKYTSLGNLPEKKSLVVLPVRLHLENYTVTESGNQIVIATAKLKIKIDRATQAITYSDLQGKIILAEADKNNKLMADTTVAGIKTYKCATSFKSPKDEALFGLGCHPLDSLSINYKGRNQDMAIKYLTGAIPVMLSTRGYGLLWDNYAESKFFGSEAGNTQFSYVSESGKMIDYYFFYGPSFDRIIDGYRMITGKAPMYPKWAFGLFQSQDRYKKQDEVISVKDNYRKNHIPVDVIVQDWYYWYPLPIGSHVMIPSGYSNPKRMVDELHKANIHGMISIWPCFGTGTNNFDALKAAGNLTDITWDNFTTHTRDTYYDAHSPKAREMYWQQARDSLVKRFGWDGWWVDQCEPDTEDPNDRKKSMFATGQGIDYFNSYSLVHTTGIYEKWRRDIPKKRIYLLARQAFAGQQRNAATLWSSDITTTFASYKNQVPQAINACVSGIPYWTSDIGGYLSRVSPEGVPDWSKPDFRELFTRWFQFGTFSPIFRIHGKGERALFSNNWDAPTKAILLKYDNLRYRLLPYIYSLSAKVTTGNYTIMRSLAFDFRSDPAVYSIPDQYMFGPAFLVNPVTAQLYSLPDADKLAKARSVYLPKTTGWYDFWTGKKLDGGQTITASAPIETMPLYIRAGSIVPMGPLMEYATEKPADKMELRIYPGADGTFTLYEDANDTYNYEKGESATFSFNWNDKKKELFISARKGSFPGMLQSRTFNIVIVQENKGTGVDAPVKFDKTVQYDGKAITVKML
ncbi:MAG: glycoside hydrolase family 31 protein [Ferruginibacter sp.]|nr:glycoside hydrolase family 31 protein [Ferruginibacter sp.]